MKPACIENADRDANGECRCNEGFELPDGDTTECRLSEYHVLVASLVAVIHDFIIFIITSLVRPLTVCELVTHDKSWIFFNFIILNFANS